MKSNVTVGMILPMFSWIGNIAQKYSLSQKFVEWEFRIKQ